MKKMLLPMLIWICALGMVIGASKALNQARQQVDLREALATLPPIETQWINLTSSDYQAIRAKTLISGSVELQVTEQSLRVRAKELADYATWRLTLNQVLFDVPQVIWQIEYLCSGKCPNGEAHLAVLTGKRIKL